MGQTVGRQSEITSVSTWVDRLPRSGGGFVICGEAGIGKSSLAETAVVRASARGARVISVTATESEASLPYAALQQILHPFTQRLESMRARPRSVLARAFGATDGEVPDVFAVGVAVLEALPDVAPDDGLLLVVDDAQWVDDSTARVLAFVARRLAEDPVLAIFIVRSGHSSPVLAAGLDTIELGALADEAALELLQTHRPALTIEQRQSILLHARGNPLALIELPPGFAGHEEETLDTRLRSAFVSRLRGVAPETSLFLLLAALNDSDSVSELQTAAIQRGLGGSEIRVALRESAATGAISIQAGRFTFLHPLVRAAIVSSADDDERRRSHSALAVAFSNDADRAVWHYAASIDGTDDEVASKLEATAERTARQGSVAVSLRAWGLAARLSRHPAERARRRVREAESALEAGRVTHALEALSAVEPANLDPVEAGRFTLVQLGVDPHAALPRLLRSATEQAERILDEGEVDLAIELALAIGENLDSAGFAGQKPLETLAKRIAVLLPVSDPRRIVVLAASDPARYSRRVADAVLSLDATELTGSTELLVRVRFNVDADPVLAAMQRRLLDSYRTHGRLRSIAFLQPIHLWNEICLGNWPEALRAVEEGTRLAVELGFPRWLTGTIIGEGFIAALRGDHERAEALILESERGALAAGANNVLTGIQLTKGVNLLAQGRYEEALAALIRPFDPRDPSHHPIQAEWMLGDIAEAAAHLGRIDEIRSLFHRDNRVSTPWQKMAEMYAAPFLAAESTSTEAAYLEALAGVVADWPTYHARLLIEYGSWLRRQRRTQEARRRLRAGRELADALAMGPWSGRARAELRALGAESEPRIPGAWEALSAQELEVAQLATLGLSNREIGERLFLSHRTVGSHLYRVYPKLGITNRAQLSAALRSPAPGD